MKMFVVALVIACCVGMASPQDLKITLVVFSGVPDPQWKITQKSSYYRQIRNLYTTAKNWNDTYFPEQIPALLGYRGFLVKEAGSRSTESLILGPNTTQLQKLLLRSMPVRIKLRPRFKAAISHAISDPEVLLTKITDFKERIVKRVPPSWEEATTTWNNINATKNNNCYNYANDKMTSGRRTAQPGKGSGEVWGTTAAQITKNGVKEAAERDGLEVVPAGAGGGIPNIPRRSRYHLVALVVAPALDYHWYRLDSNGLWSHKPGRSRITNEEYHAYDEYDDLTIQDPREAANPPGWNYVFVCFMKTDKNTVNIA